MLLESAKMASLGEMAGGIAHEINNPLAIILGRSSQIRRVLDRPEFELAFIQNGIRQIEGTAERISRIVRGLQTLSRNAEQDPMTQVPLSKIVQETLELCRERLRHHDVTLNVFVEPDIVLECRATQICQVLMNLLNNAHDAVQQLSEKWIEVRAEKNGTQAIIKVQDSGHGIPLAIAEKIMDPFVTTKEIGVGTGLGLSVSWALVLGHGGQLRYDHFSPHTLFILELPLFQASTQAS